MKIDFRMYVNGSGFEVYSSHVDESQAGEFLKKSVTECLEGHELDDCFLGAIGVIHSAVKAHSGWSPEDQEKALDPKSFEHLLHSLSLVKISQLRAMIDDYLDKWYGFTATARARRTPEWVSHASDRLVSEVVTCCECGHDYPAADLHFDSMIYCVGCRKRK